MGSKLPGKPSSPIEKAQLISEEAGFPLLRLPHELLIEIVAQLDQEDLRTLINLCIAAAKEPILLEIARAKRWKQVAIDDQDLVPVPGKDYQHYLATKQALKDHKLGSSWKAKGRNVSLLTTKLSNSDFYPAEYIQNLILDMNLCRYFTQELLRSDLNPWDLRPSVSSLEHTLGLLKPHLLNLRSIVCNGEVPQSIIDMIGNLQNRSSVQKLELQHDYREFTLYRPPDPDRDRLLYNNRRISIDLKSLQSLEKLKSLQVRRLKHDETPSLMAILPSFSHLETLVIRDETWDHFGIPGGCAIRTIFEHFMNVSQQTSDGSSKNHLPPSLTSLVLLDTHDCESLSIPDISHKNTINTNINALHIETSRLGSILPFIKCFPSPQIKNLSVSHVVTPWQKYKQPSQLNSIISLHSSTLEKINILQAWDLDDKFADNFNEYWAGKFSIQELMLGSYGSGWEKRPEDDFALCSPILTQYLNALNGIRDPDTSDGNWGDQLKRIRIDHIRPINLDTAILGQQRFRNLRILMLQPFSKKDRLTVDQHDCGIFTCKHVEESIAEELANSIASNASSELRVLVIQTYWYWLPDSKITNNRENRIWNWIDAKKDESMARAMARSLSYQDWAFLQKAEPLEWNSKFRPIPFYHELSQNLGMSNEEEERRWNYVTALPI